MSDARPPAVRSVVAFAALVATIGTWLTLAAADAAPVGAVQLPWLVVAAGCLATENLLVHFEHRREAHSISFSAVPLVIGLFTLPPVGLMAAVLLASAIQLGVIRRQPLFKLALNLSSSMLEVGIAVITFRAIAGDALEVVTWIAACAAAVAGGLAQSAVVTIAISIFQRRWEAAFEPVIVNGLTGIVNTAFAIVAVTLLTTSPTALTLFAALLPVLFISYRVHARLREKHRDLEELYQFGRQITAAVASGRVVATLISRLQELMHADDAWICLPDGEAMVRVRVESGVAVSVPMPPGGIDELLHRAAQLPNEPALLDATAGEEVSDALRSLGVRQALVAPLGQSAAQGTIVVTDRSGDVRAFGEQDIRLFGTLVSHAGASLENSQLLDKLREQAAASEHQALHDMLTGLPNRTLFGQRVAAALQAATPLAVLLLDLDRFKEVNDTLGHHNGDVLLEEVGRRLASVLRHGDTVARLGGDEFAVLLPGIASAESAIQVARGLLAVLERPAPLSGVTINLTGSIGIAIAPEHGDEPALLLQRADVAMYTAKAGQTGVALYDEERDIYSPDRLALAADLRRAIEDGELQVHYQPQVELQSDLVIGAEALVRWIDDSGWRMSPAELVSLAEHTGLIAPLTRFVMRSAVEEASRWRAQGRPLRVSVNLSARTLLDENLAGDVRGVLDEFGLPASALCLELTETTIMADQDRTIAVLEQLREVGVTIAVDDFGVGYSSLAYLARLPVGEIKIDKSFVMNMAEKQSDEMIVRSVVDLAANLGIPVVAEGVETDDARAALHALGCDLGQGYFFSRPVSSGDFLAWLTGRTSRPVTPSTLVAAS